MSYFTVSIPKCDVQMATAYMAITALGEQYGSYEFKDKAILRSLAVQYREMGHKKQAPIEQKLVKLFESTEHPASWKAMSSDCKVYFRRVGEDIILRFSAPDMDMLVGIDPAGKVYMKKYDPLTARQWGTVRLV